MAAVAAAGADAQEVIAQGVVNAAGTELLRRSPSIGRFDEKKGAKEWSRHRQVLADHMQSGGADWAAAFKFRENMMAAEQYDSASVLSDGVAGIPVLKIKHTRQTTMLALLKLTLDPSSESARIIKNCQHFSGFLVVTANEEAAGAVKGEPQALELLNARWADGTAVDEDPGALSRELHELKWPGRLDLDVYNEYFNKLTSLLIRLDMLPSDESEASVRRRLQSGIWVPVA